MVDKNSELQNYHGKSILFVQNSNNHLMKFYISSLPVTVVEAKYRLEIFMTI